MATRWIPTAATALILLVMPVTPGAQSFDAISIKPNSSGVTARSFSIRPGQLAATNVTVRHVMWNAYGVRDDEIIGGPGWLATDRFDIIATIGGNPTQSETRQMLRNLLADRFKLKVHSAIQEVPIYALVVARPDGKLGPKLRPAEGPCAEGRVGGPGGGCGFKVGTGSMAGRNATPARIAGELAGFVGRRVIDRTGLTTGFDIELEWSPDFQNDAGPSIFTAVQEQLGLKLESTRGPVEVVVIDSVERPSEN